MSAVPSPPEEVAEAAGRVIETGQRILSKRIELLRGELVAVLRAAGLGLFAVGLAVLAVGWSSCALFFALTLYVPTAVAGSLVAVVALAGAVGTGLCAARALSASREDRR